MRRRVVEEARGGVADGADERGLVDLLGEQRHDLGQVNAGHDGPDGLEFAPHVGGGVGLGVPDVDMAGPALEENEDDVFGLAPAAFILAGVGHGGGAGLKAQDVGQGNAGHAHAADAEEFAPAEAVAGAAWLSGDADHSGGPFKLAGAKWSSVDRRD